MADIIDFLKNVTVSEILLVVIAVTTVIEWLSKTVKPWTQLLQFIGRTANKEVVEKIEKQAEETGSLRGEVGALAARIDRKDAEDARNHILRFGDEIKNGVRHSEEYFNQILDDMTNYEQYCREHPEFKNERTTATESIIRRVYDKCVIEKDFL